MRKFAIIAALLLINSVALRAQDDYKKGFYVKPSGSYFFKVAPVEFPTIGGQPARDRDFTMLQATGQQAIQRDRTLTGSFGEGFRASLLGGFRFHRYLGLEIGFNYFAGAEQDMTNQHGSLVTLEGTTVANALTLYTRGKVRAFDVAPAIVFHIPTNGALKPYTKVGVIIPIGGYSETVTEASDITGQIARSQGLLPQNLPVQDALMQLSNVVRIDRTYSNPTIGFQSAVGADFWLNDRISIFAEIEYRNITVGSRRRELQSLNGEFLILSPTAGQLASGQLTVDAAPQSSRVLNYHKEINANTHNVVASGDFDPNQAADEVQNRVSFGGLGISLGLKIPLGK